MVAYAETERAVRDRILGASLRDVSGKSFLPYAFALYFTGVSARAVNRNSREALANGQCMLFERAVYEKHRRPFAVAASVIEDVALARHAKESGVPVRVIRAEQFGHVRMYDGLPPYGEAFRRILSAFS